MKAAETIIDIIYDAPLSPGGWKRVVTQMEEAFRGPVALFRRSGDTLSTIEACASADAQRVQMFETGLWREDRALQILQVARAGEIVVDTSLVSDPERKRSPFYNGYLGVLGLDRGIYGSVLAEDREQVIVSAQRSSQSGDWACHDIHLLRSLLPHLARSYRTWSKVEAIERLRDASTDALEKAGIGLILVDRTARLRFANSAAECHIESGPLTLIANRVVLGNRAENEQLQAAIRRAASVSDTGAITLMAGADAAELPISILPAPGHWGGRLVTLLLGGRSDRRPQQQRLGSLFRLTRAESRLLSALVSGERLNSYAERSGISVSTAKTHLNALFAKTGERRQSDLIRRAMSDPLLFTPF